MIAQSLGLLRLWILTWTDTQRRMGMGEQILGTRFYLSQDGTNLQGSQERKGPSRRFGVEVPRNPKHALELDKQNGNDGWKKSMQLELDQLEEFNTFKLVPKGQLMPPGYKWIPYHIVFDVKFDGRLKSWLVAGGHRTPEVPHEDVFSPVVAMESVRLGFILARLNHLQVCAGDIGNAYLNARTREKVFIIAGPEFGPELEGQRLIVDKSLYGLKTSAARFHEHLSVKLRTLGYKPSKADADLWVQNDSHGQYEYIARYVDDVISFAKDPLQLMKELEETYTMKGVGRPMYYLGGDVEHLPPDWEKEGIHTAFSASTYITDVLPELKALSRKEAFPKKKVPMSAEYHPELDDSPLCDAREMSLYRMFIGSANWIVTLGRFEYLLCTFNTSKVHDGTKERTSRCNDTLVWILRKQ